MSLPNKHTVETFFFVVALTSAMVVLLLSIYNGYSFLFIVLRSFLSFAVLIIIGKVILNLWVKLTPVPKKKEVEFRSTIDVLLGDLEEQGATGSLEGLQDNNKPSPERMMPGQINSKMQNGLQDAGNKAELVRRMGFKEK